MLSRPNAVIILQCVQMSNHNVVHLKHIYVNYVSIFKRTMVIEKSLIDNFYHNARNVSGDFPPGPVTSILCFHYKGHGFDPLSSD